MDIHEISDFADYFVICSGTSDRMLRALADDLVEQAHKQFKSPQPESKAIRKMAGSWLILATVIVHLFSA